MYIDTINLNYINYRLNQSYNIVKEYKDYYQDALSFGNRIKKDETARKLEEKIDSFHNDFIEEYLTIIKHICSDYIREQINEALIYKINHDIEVNISNFINLWKEYLQPSRMLNIISIRLTDDINDEGYQDMIVLMRNSKSFIRYEIQHNDLLIISEFAFKFLLNELGVNDDKIYEKLHYKFYSTITNFL